MAVLLTFILLCPLVLPTAVMLRFAGEPTYAVLAFFRQKRWWIGTSLAVVCCAAAHTPVAFFKPLASQRIELADLAAMLWVPYLISVAAVSIVASRPDRRGWPLISTSITLLALIPFLIELFAISQPRVDGPFGILAELLVFASPLGAVIVGNTLFTIVGMVTSLVLFVRRPRTAT